MYSGSLMGLATGEVIWEFNNKKNKHTSRSMNLPEIFSKHVEMETSKKCHTPNKDPSLLWPLQYPQKRYGYQKSLGWDNVDINRQTYMYWPIHIFNVGFKSITKILRNHLFYYDKLMFLSPVEANQRKNFKL